MLRGCDELIDHLCHKLQIKPGETTADGEFTLILSECLAACDRAPMMLVDEKVIGPVQEGEIEHILAEAKKGPGHPAPVEKPEVDHE
jgi:NADH-quinone oxidoreductase subunit E